MLTSILVKKLEEIVGKDNVITENSGLASTLMVGAVVTASSTKEVAEIIRLANQEKTPVIPLGNGTSLSGRPMRAYGSIVLSMRNMNKILEIDSENLTVTVQPGVITSQVHQAVEKFGLFYSPDPERMDYCTIGGNIAENAEGPRCFKYRMTRDCILGLEVVTPTGEIWRVGGKVIKNVSGYDLIRLFNGSIGSLGVITEATLRLIPLPQHKKTCLVSFETLKDAAQAIKKICPSKVVPSAMEIVSDPQNVDAMNVFGLQTGAEGGLIIEVDGIAEVVQLQMETLEKLCRECGSTKFEVLEVTAADLLWTNVRKTVIDWLKMSAVEAVIVPRDKIGEMLTKIQQIAKKHGQTSSTIGHVGNGKLYFVFHKQLNHTEQAIEEAFQATLELGGTVSGEHSIGTAKLKYMRAAFGDVGLDLMGKLKKAWDPNNIMNPGKVFPRGDE